MMQRPPLCSYVYIHFHMHVFTYVLYLNYICINRPKASRAARLPPQGTGCFCPLLVYRAGGVGNPRSGKKKTPTSVYRPTSVYLIHTVYMGMKLMTKLMTSGREREIPAYGIIWYVCV